MENEEDEHSGEYDEPGKKNVKKNGERGGREKKNEYTGA
jgi:hypothetical protein